MKVTRVWADEDGESHFEDREAAGDGFASVVDLLRAPDARTGLMGAGVVHHVAFRAPNDDEPMGWREEIRRLGFDASPATNRSHVRSIYFREPGGVLFEIATDAPGFADDEPAEELGAKLTLPSWMERQLLPTPWFRNTWSWGGDHEEGGWPKPRLEQAGEDAIAAEHATLGDFRLTAAPDPDGKPPSLLFGWRRRRGRSRWGGSARRKTWRPSRPS